MLLEDFLASVERPLGAMTNLVNILDNNIYDEWSIYTPETRKQAIKIRDMLFLLKHTLNHINDLKTEYTLKVEEWYKNNKNLSGLS